MSLKRPGDYTRNQVVVVGFCDLGTIELSGFEFLKCAEVVDVDLAVNLRRVELGAAFPEQGRLFAFTFGEDDKFATDPLLLGALRYLLLQLHQLVLPRLYGAFWELGVEGVGFRTFFIGVVKDAEPVEFSLGNEFLQDFKVAERLAGKTDDE